MSFWNKMSIAAGIVEDCLQSEAEKYEKALKQKLRSISDAQLKHMYENRYENPKLKDFQIRLIEEEAHRRGIY